MLFRHKPDSPVPGGPLGFAGSGPRRRRRGLVLYSRRPAIARMPNAQDAARYPPAPLCPGQPSRLASAYDECSSHLWYISSYISVNPIAPGMRGSAASCTPAGVSGTAPWLLDAPLARNPHSLARSRGTSTAGLAPAGVNLESSSTAFDAIPSVTRPPTAKQAKGSNQSSLGILKRLGSRLFTHSCGLLPPEDWQPRSTIRTTRCFQIEAGRPRAPDSGSGVRIAAR